MATSNGVLAKLIPSNQRLPSGQSVRVAAPSRIASISALEPDAAEQRHFRPLQCDRDRRHRDAESDAGGRRLRSREPRVLLVVGSRQKHPCSRVNRLTKTRASGYNLAALSVGLYLISACFSRRATCGFERAEQLKCRLDATRLPGIPSVSYIVPRHVGDAALYTEAGQFRL
jgi:hypothetical protein